MKLFLNPKNFIDFINQNFKFTHNTDRYDVIRPTLKNVKTKEVLAQLKNLRRLSRCQNYPPYTDIVLFIDENSIQFNFFKENNEIEIFTFENIESEISGAIFSIHISDFFNIYRYFSLLCEDKTKCYKKGKEYIPSPVQFIFNVNQQIEVLPFEKVEKDIKNVTGYSEPAKLKIIGSSFTINTIINYFGGF